MLRLHAHSPSPGQGTHLWEVSSETGSTDRQKGGLHETLVPSQPSSTSGTMRLMGTAGARPAEGSWFSGRLNLLLLGGTVALLGSGGLLHLIGSGSTGDLLWIVAGSLGAAVTLWSMLESLRHGRLGIDVIALLALVGALVVGEYLAASVIAVMVASGRALEEWAAGRARRDLNALLERAPTQAHRYEAGSLQTVPLDDVRIGDLLMVGPGEIVPVDGTVQIATAVIDESALTGEALPVERSAGEAVRSGAVNSGSPFDLRATTRADDSTYAGIVRLVAKAEASQAPFVRLADRYALWFLGVTLLVGGVAWILGGASRAVAVLVVATPCPLVLAAPVAFVSGLSLAARRGVVIKGGAVLERLARCTTVLLDKTGTLTVGEPVLSSIVPAGALPAEEVLTLAASLDQVSPHVLASAVVRAAGQRCGPLALPTDVEEVAGQGVRGLVDGRPVSVGKAAWVGAVGTPPWVREARRRARIDGALTVFVGADDRAVGALLFDDPIRPDAARTLRRLRRNGIDRIVMVTGDREEVAEAVGSFIGVDQVLAERTPPEKLEAVELERRNAPTIMVGDGINDAPALALADVGVAMGARGATASSEAADVVLAVDRIDRLGEARSLSVRTRRIALESVVSGMGMSLAAMGLAAAGLLPALWGALLQEAIDVLVILNAMRVLRWRPAEAHLGQADSALAQRFQTEHRAIEADLLQLKATADSLGSLPPSEAVGRLRAIYELLQREVLPHEEAEETVLYPALNRVLGGADPTGPMSRGHAEITHRIRRLGRFLDELRDEGPDAVETADLRNLLYGLHAILSLHTAQEEESYLSLGDGPDVPSAPVSSCNASTSLARNPSAGPTPRGTR